jgi:hypothetical protein
MVEPGNPFQRSQLDGRITPRGPALRISRSTVQQATSVPSLRSWRQTLPDPFNLDAQHVVSLDTDKAQRRVALLRRVAPVARRRNLYHLTARLDTVGMAVLVDELRHDL